MKKLLFYHSIKKTRMAVFAVTITLVACKKPIDNLKPQPPKSIIPVAGFSFKPSQDNSLVITFEDTSKNVASRYWDFGDPFTTTDTSTQKKVSYNYAYAYSQLMTPQKRFTVKLVVVSPTGEKDSIEQTVSPVAINPSEPSFKITLPTFTGLTNRNPGRYIFTATNISTNVVGYYWDFGDGSTPSTEKNPVHIFTTGGTHNVSLTVSDAYGNKAYSKVQPVTPTVVTGITIKEIHLLESPPKNEAGTFYDDDMSLPDISFRIFVGDGAGGLIRKTDFTSAIANTYTAGWNDVNFSFNISPTNPASNIIMIAFEDRDNRGEDPGTQKPSVGDMPWSTSEIIDTYYPGKNISKIRAYPARGGDLVVALTIEYTTQ